MTHDELQDYIDKFDAAGMVNEPAVKALRAVVELHKPVQSYMFEEEACSHCSSEKDRSETLYPCPTIQAIQSVLE